MTTRALPFASFFSLLLLAGCPFGSKEETQTEDTSGGGGGGGSVFEDFCGELDECNLLKGMSAGECADSFEACTDDLLASEASDVEAAMEECLSETSSCDDLSYCYWHEVPYC